MFLDRDGVLVEALVRGDRPVAPTTLKDFTLVAEAAAAVARLRRAGLVSIVVTNQPEVARGSLPEDVLGTMHQRLREEIPVDDIFVCPHDGDGCACRKPRPGLLHEAAAKWGLDPAGSFLVGDRWRDIEAGRAVGCYTILLERRYSACATADTRVATVVEATDVILARLGA